MPTITTPSIVLSDLSFSWPDGSGVIDHLSTAFGRGRTGLVGANGAGKSTLVRLVTGDLVPTGGRLTTTGEVDLLPQRLRSRADDTVADLLGVGPRLLALRAILAGDATERQFELLADVWDVESRAAAALADVGLGHLDGGGSSRSRTSTGTGTGSGSGSGSGSTVLDRPVSTLSGGQAVLVAIAGVRLRGRPIAVFDEPSNDLDRRSRGLLLDVVDRWRGTLVVVSHDRELLEHVDEIAELRGGSMTVFGGTWSAYEQQLAVLQAAAERDVRAAEQVFKAERRQRIEAETTIARRAKAGAKAGESMPKIMANQLRGQAEATAGSLRKAHASSEQEARVAVDTAERRLRRDDTIVVDLPDPAVPASRRLAELTVRGRTVVVQGVERIAVVGDNGSGKTTLLEQLVGAPDARPHPLPDTHAVALTGRVAHLGQKKDSLDDGLTVLDNVRRAAPAVPPREVRNRLARFLIRGDIVDRLGGTLSGGERFRVALAGLLLADPPPELLVLDEPTNDLDMASTDHLLQALRGYRGALVIVSHDEAFLERLGLDARVEVR
ncbi:MULTISPECIES: ATP-binding cassette domain-containing protein [unclassified Frigoribacterium]|uniref:ATP-binding cassette domain-containing protein n=1 Tax=unclassified Frigoribacterium TaxID=2627005 RepID=UPI0006F61522|nr:MULTISPECIES: ATP-binding cassette domain-containing protein [unclassified Frigoribacterium]KQO48813.1 ABC transporter [Frigoribacterium sp. Leaf254]KQT41027.1 ABC transporter [Frigoribacterium sp. Leaf415]